MKIISKLQIKLILLSLTINALMVKVAEAATIPSALDRLKNTAEEVGFSTDTTITPQAIIMNVVMAVLGFTAILFLVMTIYAGYQWMTAGGNEEKVTQAKKRLQFAVIGLVVIITAYSITIYVSKILIKSTTPGYYNFP